MVRMDEYVMYKFMEFVIFTTFLLIVFLLTQIWFMWEEIDNDSLRSETFLSDFFSRKNMIFIFFLSGFFMVHELIEEINLLNSYLYFELFRLLGIICVALIVHNWHFALKSCANKKPAEEMLLEICGNREVKEFDLFSRLNKINKWQSSLIAGFCSLFIAFSVPFSTIFFTVVIGLLFIPPFLVLASMLIGAYSISKDLLPRSNHWA